MIKKYNQFNESLNFPNTKEEIDLICKEYEIMLYTINDDMSVDVDGYVHVGNKGLSKIPLKFNIVNYGFNCNNNRLTSLEGCPKEIGGGFFCINNRLTSLEGMPSSIKGNIYCRGNSIKNFKGVPEDFDGEFQCSYPISNVYKLFNNNSKCIYWINEYDVIQGDNIIIDRLEEVFIQLGIKMYVINEIIGYNLINN